MKQEVAKNISGMSKVEKIFAALGLFTALLQILAAVFVALYIALPSGFVVTVNPNTQLDFCSENGRIVFEKASSWSDPSDAGFYIRDLSIINGSWTFTENVSVANIESPWWTFGYLSKPYNDQVILIVENKPPGVDIPPINSPFSVEFEDHSKIMGVPPFQSNIILKITPNATLARGPYYVTIKGIGQDGKTESTCTSVLMVNRNCAGGMIVVG